MPQYLFISSSLIEADNLEEAEDHFADNSWDFAANADRFSIDSKEDLEEVVKTVRNKYKNLI